MDTVLRQDLIDVALRATDAYLGIEKHAMKNGFATNQDIHDFTFYLSQAHDALTKLDDIDNHTDYMYMHLETMMKLARHDDKTIYDLPYTHVPQAEVGEIEEETQLDEISQEMKARYKAAAKKQVRQLKPHAKSGEYRDLAANLIARRERGIAMAEETESLDEAAEKGLAAKAAKSGVSLSTLKKVYARGMAAWRTGHRPGTTPQQWGMARVNSYITKGKTYHTADKDLREESKKKSEEHLTDDDIDDIVKSVDWEDIAHTYDDDELEKEEQLEEKLTPQARIKKQREFTRTGTKRNILLQMKLKRPSSPSQIQRRAVVAARNALAKRFLQGRTRDQLSPQEKDILEARLKRMRELGIQQIVAQRLVPKIRQIEQKRLKSRR